MADCEQVLQEEMRIYEPSFTLEVDAPVPSPWTGADGAETPFSEYSLYFKTTFCSDGRGAGEASSGGSRGGGCLGAPTYRLAPVPV